MPPETNTRTYARGRNNTQEKLPLRQRLLGYGGFDVPFMVIVTALLCIGLVMMFSASYVYAIKHWNDPYHFIKRQLIFAGIGFVLMILISKLNLNVLRKLAIPGIIIAFILLVVVLFYHTDRGEFKRWIPIGGMTIQPSEVAKVALILFFAFAMEKYQRPQYNRHAKKDPPLKRFFNYWGSTLLYLGILLAMVLLIALESHVSGTLITLAIGAFLIFIGEQRLPLLFYLIAGAVVIAAGLFLYNNPQYLGANAAARIIAHKDPASDLSGDNWQTTQSLLAVGSGGWFGQGFGNSIQKHLYLPEPMNDFVFAIVCEELGFFGAFGIVLLYVALVWRGFMIALHTRNRFGTLLVIGIVLQVGLQAALNIGVVTAVLPNTGIPLPFFSYGGTALLILLCEMGIVLAVSRTSREIKR